MSSAKRNSSSTSVCTLDLACNLLRLKSFLSKRYLYTIVAILESICNHGRNIMLNSVEASTQPCLTPFVTGNGSENSPLFWTLASIPSWNCRTIAMNLAEQPLRHNFPKSLTTVSNGKVNKGHVQVHILFLAFLLKQLSCWFEEHKKR